MSTIGWCAHSDSLHIPDSTSMKLILLRTFLIHPVLAMDLRENIRLRKAKLCLKKLQTFLADIPKLLAPKHIRDNKTIPSPESSVEALLLKCLQRSHEIRKFILSLKRNSKKKKKMQFDIKDLAELC